MISRDVVIIGAGHNGLVCAFYLAKAGLRPLVLERRPIVGGVAVTEEIYPGFRCPTIEHVIGPLVTSVARDLKLKRRGLRLLEPEVALFAPTPDGRALLLYRTVKRSSAAIANFSAKDAEQFVAWHEVIEGLGSFLRRLWLRMPPDLDRTTAADTWSAVAAGFGFFGLSRADRGRLLRWLTLPVADLVGEWFTTDILQAVLASRGLDGAGIGPRAAGTGLNLLLHAAASHNPVGAPTFAAGGPSSLTGALMDAAREAGAEIRTSAPVSQLVTKDGRIRAAVLASGEEIEVATVVSNADPKHTLLALVSQEDLDLDFRARLHAYRSAGTVAKVNLALRALPTFIGLDAMPEQERRAALTGRIHVGPTLNYLDRAADAAKYGDCSNEPILDITIPSVADPSLAPAGQHIMSIRAQFAPYALRNTTWAHMRNTLAAAVIRGVSAYAPHLTSLILHQQVITPADLETQYGLTGGHLRHGELALDQLFTMRPLLGWARYRTPVGGLYLCGSGTHPGVGLTAASGANASRAVLEDLRRL